MGLGKMLGGQVLKRVTKGKVQRPGRIQALVRLPTLLRLGIALLRDSRVPLPLRASVLGALILVFSPLDFIGDIPVVGQFWDFTLAVTILDAFVQWAPADVVNEHIRELRLENKIRLRSI